MAAPVLVSRWTLDEDSGNRLDIVGPNTLTPTNGPFSGEFAPVVTGGASISLLSASAQRVSITNAAQAGLNPSLNSFSISVWFKPNLPFDGNSYVLVGKGATGGAPFAQGYMLFVRGLASTIPGRITLDAGDNTDTTSACQYHTTDQIVDNAWNHVVANVNRATKVASIWLNGRLQAPSFGSSRAINAFGLFAGAVTPNADFSIGSYSQNNGAGFGAFFNGLIDDVRFYRGNFNQGYVDILYGQPIPLSGTMLRGHLAQITARAGIVRSGTGRLGVAPGLLYLKQAGTEPFDPTCVPIPSNGEDPGVSCNPDVPNGELLWERERGQLNGQLGPDVGFTRTRDDR